MTYKDLLAQIQYMTKDEQNKDVTVLLMDTDEVVPVCDFVTEWNVTKIHRDNFCIDQVEGVLDDGHPYFTVAF